MSECSKVNGDFRIKLGECIGFERLGTVYQLLRVGRNHFDVNPGRVEKVEIAPIQVTKVIETKPKKERVLYPGMILEGRCKCNPDKRDFFVVKEVYPHNDDRVFLGCLTRKIGWGARDYGAPGNTCPCDMPLDELSKWPGFASQFKEYTYSIVPNRTIDNFKEVLDTCQG